VLFKDLVPSSRLVSVLIAMAGLTNGSWALWDMSSITSVSNFSEPFVLCGRPVVSDSVSYDTLWTAMFYILSDISQSGITTSRSISSPIATGIDVSRLPSATPSPSDQAGEEDEVDVQKHARRTAGLAAGIALGSVAVIVCLVVYVMRSRKRRREGKGKLGNVATPPTEKDGSSSTTQGHAAVVYEMAGSRDCVELPAERALPKVEDLDELVVITLRT
jgi:hypothetical protein